MQKLALWSTSVQSRFGVSPDKVRTRRIGAARINAVQSLVATATGTGAGTRPGFEGGGAGGGIGFGCGIGAGLGVGGGGLCKHAGYGAHGGTGFP